MLEQGIGKIQKEVVESVPGQFLKTMAEPVIGRYRLAHYRRTGEPAWLDKHFGPRRSREVHEVELEDSFTALSEIHTKLSGVDGAPEQHLNSDFQSWVQIKSHIQAAMGESVIVSDYVSFSNTNAEHTLFYYRDGSMHSLSLSAENCTPEGIRAACDETVGVALSEESFLTRDNKKHIRKSAAVELAITALQPDDANTQTLRFLTPITNDFPLRRNAEFEREGDMFEELRDRGATRYGEFMEAQRLLVTYGMRFQAEAGVTLDPDLLDVCIRARGLAKTGKIPERTSDFYKTAQKDLEQYAQETYYAELVAQYYREHPEAIHALLASDVYKSHRDTFLDVNLAGRGQTEIQIATAMMANYHLGKFEGKDPTTSPSQKYQKNGQKFHADLDAFVASNPDTTLSPMNSDDADFRAQELIRVKALVVEDPFVKRKLDENKKAAAIASAERSLQAVPYELKRHKTGRALIDTLKRYAPEFFEDNNGRTKPFRAVISNMILARVPGESRPTMQSWHRDGGYFPDGVEPLQFDEEDATTQTVEEAIRHIFNAEVIATDGGSESAYESQVSRIYTEGNTIVKFLLEDERVPENVRQLAQVLTSEELGDIVVDCMGPVTDNNPAFANKFFKDGFHKFQIMAQHRFVTDFVRGVETELVKRTRGRMEQKKRTLVPVWKNFDFSSVPPEILQDALTNALAVGSHRIDVLNHEEGVEETTLKDVQSRLEMEWFYDTNDMRYLRWKKFWNVMTTFGIASDCLCPLRENIFNANVLPQY